MITPRFKPWIGSAVVLAVLCAWIGWLRAPGLNVTLWNVDESIHATAAQVLLDGGVMYRDAVDQRTPLTYYAFAAIFKVAGVNNLFAVRVVIAGMIVGTAFGLFVLGRRTRSFATGLWAAFTYAAFANYLLFVGDTHAAHTEWFVALFTTTAAVVFLNAEGVPRFSRSAAAGALFGLAFLSKQPGLADFGAPVGTLLYLGLLRAAPWRQILIASLGLFAGLLAVVGFTLGLILAAGAGRDFFFYTWTYNVQFYGPEVSWGERLLSAHELIGVLANSYPVLLIALICAALAVAIRLAQVQYSEDQYRVRRWECYLLLWCATSLIGAMSSGRGYHHYFFQCLPPLAWLAATLPAWLTDYVRTPRPLFRRILAGILMAAFGASILWTPLAARKVTFPPPDPALPIAAFIREHSTPDDTIFAWGYNPDIYLYADRKPASRFLYCSFQTGLIPWTNDAPGIDTRYAIVPGAMDQLLADLAHHRPTFIVDCGVGPHRRFSKYPLANFAPLAAFVATHYVELDPATFTLRGFRVFMLRDRELRRDDSIKVSDTHPAPTLGAPPNTGTIIAAAGSTQPLLQRLSVSSDETELVAVRFPPARSIKFVAKIPPDVAKGQRLQAVAEWADGTRTVSDHIAVDSSPVTATAAQAVEFALPRVLGVVPADGVRALASPNATFENGQRFFNLHAPALLRYPLAEGVTGIRGRFGIDPGAYAPANPTPTDGAVFTVRWIGKEGTTRVLLEKWLRPAAEPSDRAAQAFHIQLEANTVGGAIEFEISPGPDGVMASDWTYWSDLRLEVSP